MPIARQSRTRFRIPVAVSGSTARRGRRHARTSTPTSIVAYVVTKKRWMAVTPRGTLVYVHGASDRAPQVDNHVARIESQLASNGLSFAVVPSRWGEAAGAALDRVELALPHLSDSARAPARSLSDLGALAADSRSTPLTATPAHRESDDLLHICRYVESPYESITRSDGSSTSLGEACRNAAVVVASSAEYEAARSAAVADGQLLDVVAQAVAAHAASDAPPSVAHTVEVRIAQAVMGVALAAIVSGYIGVNVGPELKRWATDVLVPHRADLLREAGLGPADIVLYQRSGAAIRSFVRATLVEASRASGPVVALGNSLGGIILVDALAEAGSPAPNLLVTVGSQAPLLATFGALDPLDLTGHVPFQPWLNIYDRRDLLGFVARPVWPDQEGITDFEVDLGVGFPDAHGATYLASPAVFEAIRQHPAIAEAEPAKARNS